MVRQLSFTPSFYQMFRPVFSFDSSISSFGFERDKLTISHHLLEPRSLIQVFFYHMTENSSIFIFSCTPFISVTLAGDSISNVGGVRMLLSPLIFVFIPCLYMPQFPVNSYFLA